MDTKKLKAKKAHKACFFGEWETSGLKIHGWTRYENGKQPLRFQKKLLSKKSHKTAEIGMKYLICHVVVRKLWTATKIDEFNAARRNLKNGIRFCLSQSWLFFQAAGRTVPQDIMDAKPNPNLVDFEMDIYWVPGWTRPVKWLKNIRPFQTQSWTEQKGLSSKTSI